MLRGSVLESLEVRQPSINPPHISPSSYRWSCLCVAFCLFPPAVRMLAECRLLYQLCPLQSPPWRNKLIKSYLWCSFFSLTEAIAVVKAVIISIFLSCNIETSGNHLVSHNRAHMRDSTVYYSCCAHCVWLHENRDNLQGDYVRCYWYTGCLCQAIEWKLLWRAELRACD